MIHALNAHVSSAKMREAIGDKLLDDLNENMNKFASYKQLPLQSPASSGKGSKRVEAIGLAQYFKLAAEGLAIPNCIAPQSEPPNAKTDYFVDQVNKHIPPDHPQFNNLKEIALLRSKTDALDTLDGSEKKWIPNFTKAIDGFGQRLNYPQHTTVNQMTMLGAVCLETVGAVFDLQCRLKDRQTSWEKTGETENALLVATASWSLLLASQNVFQKAIDASDGYEGGGRSNSLGCAMCTPKEVNKHNFPTQMYESILYAQKSIMKRRVVRIIVSMDLVSKENIKEALNAEDAEVRKQYVEAYSPLSEDEIKKTLTLSMPSYESPKVTGKRPLE